MQPQQPYYGPPGQQPPAVQPNYDFIVNPQQPAPRKPIGSGSMLNRILVVGVGLMVLIIAFAIIKGLLSGGGNSTALVQVVQDQQEIVHLTTTASNLQGISTTNKNFAVTSKSVLTSQQSQLIGYLAVLKHKLSIAQLNLKVSAAVDAQLVSAQASSTYDTTFQQVLKDRLAQYKLALKSAYNQTSGVNGRKLLTTDYNSAVLLERQLSTTE